MTDWVADYSWARPHPKVLAAAGCIGVVRYVGPGNRGRDVTAGEVSALHAAGLGIGLVWETTTTAALAGWQAGYADVAAANRHADTLGYPAHLPIFYAVDTDVTPAQVRGPVADTFRGAIAQSPRPVRPYGEADVLDILCGELGLMDCGWQCAAWSRGLRSTFRCMFQQWPPIMNDTVDFNELGPMPCDFLWHPTITYDAPMGHGGLFGMATQEDWDRLQRMISEGVQQGIEATVNTGDNVAGEARGQGIETRTAGGRSEGNLAGVTRDEGEATRALMREIDGGNYVELEAVQGNLASLMRSLQADGTLAPDADIDAIAARLTITARPPPAP